MKTKTGITINLSDLVNSLKRTIDADIEQKKRYIERAEEKIKKSQDGKTQLKLDISMYKRDISVLTEMKQNVISLQAEALRTNRTPESVRQRLNELGDRLKPEEARKIESLINNEIKNENKENKTEISKQIKAIQRLANKLNMGDRIITIKDKLGQPIGLSRSVKGLLEMIKVEMNSKMTKEFLHIGEGRKNDSNIHDIAEIDKTAETLSIATAEIQKIQGIDAKETQEYLRTLESNYLKQKEQMDKKVSQETQKRQTEKFKKTQSRIEQNNERKSKDSGLVTMEDMEKSYKETSAVEKRSLFGRIREQRNRENQNERESERTNE